MYPRQYLVLNILQLMLICERWMSKDRKPRSSKTDLFYERKKYGFKKDSCTITESLFI